MGRAKDEPFGAAQWLGRAFHKVTSHLKGPATAAQSPLQSGNKQYSGKYSGLLGAVMRYPPAEEPRSHLLAPKASTVIQPPDPINGVYRVPSPPQQCRCHSRQSINRSITRTITVFPELGLNVNNLLLLISSTEQGMPLPNTQVQNLIGGRSSSASRHKVGAYLHTLPHLQSVF